LLKATYAGIKRADPGAEVVGGAITVKERPSPQKFVSDMYQAGAKRYFDSFAVHAYAPSVGGVMDMIESIRRVMDWYGDPAPIWVNEFGWASGGPDSYYTTNEAGQARRTEALLRRLFDSRERLNLRGIAYYDWIDWDGW